MLSLSIAALLFGVNMPNNVVGKTIDFVSGALGHFSKSLCLSLVLKGIAGEVDA